MATTYYVSEGGTIYTAPRNPSYAGSSTGGFGEGTKTFSTLTEAKEESSIIRTTVQDVSGNVVLREYNPTQGIVTSTVLQQNATPIVPEVPNYVQLGTEIINARTGYSPNPFYTPKPTLSTTSPVNQYFKYSFIGESTEGKLILRPENMQTPVPKPKPTITQSFARGVSVLFGAKETTAVGFSAQEEYETRQIILGELQRTKTPFLSNPLRWTAEGVSYGFSKRENLGNAYQLVYNSYISRGYSEQVAFYKTQIASERFIRDIRGEFAFETAVGVGSNVVGGMLVSSTAKAIPTVFKVSSNAVYYGSRTVGMGIAGAFEGISFAQARSSFTTRQPLKATDYLMAGGFGAVSSIGAQVFIEQGFRGFVFKAKNVPVVYGRGTTARESVLKFFDPLEEVSDSVSRLAGGGIPMKTVFPFTNVLSRTQPYVEQPSVGKSVKTGYVGTPTLSYTYTQTTLPSSFSQTQTRTQTISEVTPISRDLVKVKSQTFPAVLPRAQPNVNPIIDPKTVPVIPRPQVQVLPRPTSQPKTTPFPNILPNVLPNVQPNVNPFVGDVPIAPFIPPMGGGYGKNLGFNTFTKQKKAYIPSLTAVTFGIKAKKGRKIDVISGISLRPII